MDEDAMCISTDAISLDGLLDTVSCGSNFSPPPSPVQYQSKYSIYYILDKLISAIGM